MDETGIVAWVSDPEALARSVNEFTPISTVGVPTSQPDFNVAGSFDPTRILTGGAQIVTQVAGAIGAVGTAKATAGMNAAIGAQNQRLALQQLATAGKIAEYQNATQLVRAQQEYERAAGGGGISGTAVLVIVGVAGLALAAFQFLKRR